jgi:hypothetical protein
LRVREPGVEGCGSSVKAPGEDARHDQGIHSNTGTLDGRERKVERLKGGKGRHHARRRPARPVTQLRDLPPAAKVSIVQEKGGARGRGRRGSEGGRERASEGGTLIERTRGRRNEQVSRRGKAER